MSHRATNWAVQQRGLKPATKIVLWHLCDRHNPDYGCFPSQDQLAYDAEISVASLNEHLRRLEEAGLIRRVRSKDPKTNRQQRTRYILGFEAGFTQEPTPDSGDGFVGTEAEQEGEPTPETGDGSDSRNGPEPTPDFGESRLQNLESNNPVREPLREPVKEEEDAHDRASCGFSVEFFSRLLCALGLDPGRLPGWWQGEAPRRHVERWMRDLGLSEDAILAVAAETRAQHPEPPDGPKALDRAMARRAALDRCAADGPARRRRAAPAAPAASESDQIAFFAEWVNGDGFLPPGAVSNTMAGRLIASGQVTRFRLVQRGVTY